MKEKITAFIHNLLIYDYILFASAFALFILFIILAVLLRRKLGLALFFLLFGFATLVLGPTIGYIEMHKYLFKNSTQVLSQKKLNFVEAIVVKGKITNESKFNFKKCKVTASVFKTSTNKLKNYVYKLKPLKKMSIFEYDIPKGETKEFKIIVEPFSYARDYNLSLKASCK
ncbi:DUF2393 domain-containing protein [Sulfurimonas sp.]|uniref:DUF2393 domain-containing protein n=1 Tax=Sulfurimonas sp. TaxID=2022749 RepID=UPI0026176F89|nr:DUF2393 domain-containing protein [Sulfurimonas sp.]